MFSSVSCRLQCLSLLLSLEVTRLVLGLDEDQSQPGKACFGLVSTERERNVKLVLLLAACARNQGIYSTEQSPRVSESVV